MVVKMDAQEQQSKVPVRKQHKASSLHHHCKPNISQQSAKLINLNFNIPVLKYF